mgnify:CR=1 FL=1
MAGITEMHAQFWREDGERLETENTELWTENAKLRAALKRMTRQRDSFRRELANMNNKCQGYYRLCSKWDLVSKQNSTWTVVNRR